MENNTKSMGQSMVCLSLDLDGVVFDIMSPTYEEVYRRLGVLLPREHGYDVAELLMQENTKQHPNLEEYPVHKDFFSSRATALHWLANLWFGKGGLVEYSSPILPILAAVHAVADRSLSTDNKVEIQYATGRFLMAQEHLGAKAARRVASRTIEALKAIGMPVPPELAACTRPPFLGVIPQAAAEWLLSAPTKLEMLKTTLEICPRVAHIEDCLQDALDIVRLQSDPARLMVVLIRRPWNTVPHVEPHGLPANLVQVSEPQAAEIIRALPEWPMLEE